ncbi:site-specific DNA-methyltransferase [Staphylococcus epidermidis]|uniref:DNA methyltransferase n=1 Tax=Staphylococcus epidermidis TaxID=1282 RepID=UPI00119D323E|nr:DNA methyltransferase [Staphylococcus epidermidis]MCG1395183.1 site-specific DNA-methyltransferase [Staphylococcus epidermidis]MCG2090979.1 site-specific DNA-methyltransferase [Staphylococcus epidermidis]
MTNNSHEQLSFRFKNDNYNYDKIHVKQSTFLGGVSAPVHNWFRLTPSFGPELVDVMLKKLNTSKDDIVLDPFSGAGTTLYQTKFNGIESYGFEINPFLHFVCKTSTNLNLSLEKLEYYFKKIDELFHVKLQETSNLDVENLDIEIPPIHNVYRWWRKDVLKDLLILRELIKNVTHNEDYRNFFLLALASKLIPDLTNVTLGRLQLHFVDKSNETIDVWSVFSSQTTKMIDDLRTLNQETKDTFSKIYNTNSTETADININKKINRVITSPPYPNRYSYVWNTRPYLYFFEMMTEKKSAAELDKITIGGTWGTATSILQKGKIEPLYPIIEKVVSPIVEEIRLKDNLMANYVMKYFNLIAKQIMNQEKFVSNDVKCAYVVGNSWIKDVYVETDKILSDIFVGLDLNYKVDDIHRFRKRNSGKNLYESIVYVSK